ncbi:UDP-2,3-diacylglucosamine diphosphatase [Granulosicoccaceae sp. 1_MG-2023]|nr:UDP-2,3-diacylglucosamine diphosphatase [Granulosicoccaceae sp. 1_MG-2023]
MSKLKFRSIFISDVHLGTKNCKAGYLLDFLQQSDCAHLYLVGDIFDLWQMKKSVHWSKEQSAVVNEIFRKAANGTRVTYIPGNHDALLRDFSGTRFLGIDVRLNAEHTAADGRRFFVSHGDEFDSAVRHNKLLLFIGDHSYSALLRLNRWMNRYQRLRGKPYWSLSGWLKTRLNNAAHYIAKFENAAARAAAQQQFDGYICGHIHKAGIRMIDGALYCNDGDWVEHCTALTEDENGWLQLLHWSDHARIEAISQDGVVENLNLPIDPAAVAQFLAKSA